MKATLFILIILMTSCVAYESNRAAKQLEDLEGVWCFTEDGQTLCEEWLKIEYGDYIGKGFQIQNGDTTYNEELRIVKTDGKLTYSALVYAQNDAQWINFELRTNVDDVMIFENETHDFPKQIRIQFPSNELMNVYVLGDEDDGFTHQFTRQ